MDADVGADAPSPPRDDAVAAGPRWGVELPVVASVLGAVAAIVYRVWDRSWSTPFVHAGDAMAHLALLETVGWTGTPAPNDRLGAPYSVDWVDMPSGADRGHLIVLRGLRAMTGDPVAAANLYLLLAIVMVGLAAYVVMRRLSCSPLASGVASVVFAVAPAQFARASVGHLFLANYVAVPIAVYLALWASGGLGPVRPGWRRWAAPAVLVVVVGSASPYYAVFGLIIIAAVGAIVAVRRRSWRAVLRPSAVSIGIMAVVVANVAGEALRRGGDAGVRVPLDSDAYGLRITQMLLPIRDHRMGVLSEWADRAFRVDVPGDRGAALGLLMLIGLVALGVWAIRRIGRASPGADGNTGDAPAGTTEATAGTTNLLGTEIPGRPGVLARLSVVALASLGVATVGGLGMVLATVGVTQIRAWSRMAIFVGFVGAVVLAMLLDGLSRRHAPSTLVRVAGASVLVLVAVFDQFGTGSLPSPSYNEQRWTADVELAGDLQAALPDDSMVFQLPVGTFPAELPVGSISANDLLGPAVAGDGSLRWNVGSLSGRSGDWQRSVTALPAGQLLGDLAAADMAAVVIDRRGLDADAAGLEADVIAQLGPPEFVTSDGSRAWWDLRPLRAELVARSGDEDVRARGAAVTRPIGVVVEGSPGARSTGDARARHLGRSAAIVLSDPSTDGAPAPVRVGFTLTGAPGASVEVVTAGRTRRIELGDRPVPVELQVPLRAGGTTRVELRTDAPPLGGPESTWGDMRLRLDGLSVRDSRLQR